MSDVKSLVEQVVKKIQADPSLMSIFKDDPIKTLEGLSGIDIPDNMEEEIVKGVKAAIAGNKISGIADTVKKLF